MGDNLPNPHLPSSLTPEQRIMRDMQALERQERARREHRLRVLLLLLTGLLITGAVVVTVWPF